MIHLDIFINENLFWKILKIDFIKRKNHIPLFTFMSRLDPHYTDETAECKRVTLHQLIHRFLTNFHFFLVLHVFS